MELLNIIKINKKVLQKSLPVIFGYCVLGLACGMCGQKAGLTPFEMLAMSVLAYAGSAQFIGIAMIMQGASLLSIGLTILIVNLRHVLFSATLMQFLEKKNFSFLTFFGHGITDETFAVNLNTFQTSKEPQWSPEEAFAVNSLCCISWSLNNAIGCYASEFIHLDAALATYMLTAMFIGIWSYYLVNRQMLILGLFSGILATILSIFVPYKLHIVLATLITSGLACYVSLKNEGGDF